MKDLLHLYSDRLYFKNVTEKTPIKYGSLTLLAYSIDLVLNKNSKILVTILGKTQHQYIRKLSAFLQTKKHQIYTYDKPVSSSLWIDELAFKTNELDYLIKIFIDSKNQNAYIKILDKNLQSINKHLLEKIVESYNENLVFKFDSTTAQSFNNIKYQTIVKSSTSKSGILKPFIGIRQRYKSKTYLFHQNNLNSFEISKSLLTSYPSDFIAKNKSLSIKKIKTLLYFFEAYFAREKISSIIHQNEVDKIDIFLRINNKFQLINSNLLAMIYLDFYLEEYKRAHVDISKFNVLIPHSANNGVKELLSQYNVSWEYFDEATYKDLLKNPNYVFAYNENNFIANPKYSNEFNNHYFITCLIWMINSYLNRNNLLSFKHNRIIECFGQYKQVNFQHKIVVKNIDYLIEFTKEFVKNKPLKNIQNCSAILSYEDSKFYLFKLSNLKNHEIIVYYDFAADKIKVITNLCYVYKFKPVFAFFDTFKAKVLTSKIFKLIKKFLSKKHNNKSRI